MVSENYLLISGRSENYLLISWGMRGAGLLFVRLVLVATNYFPRPVRYPYQGQPGNVIVAQRQFEFLGFATPDGSPVLPGAWHRRTENSFSINPPNGLPLWLVASESCCLIESSPVPKPRTSTRQDLGHLLDL